MAASAASLGKQRNQMPEQLCCQRSLLHGLLVSSWMLSNIVQRSHRIFEVSGSGPSVRKVSGSPNHDPHQICARSMVGTQSKAATPPPGQSTIAPTKNGQDLDKSHNFTTCWSPLLEQLAASAAGLWTQRGSSRLLAQPSCGGSARFDTFLTIVEMFVCPVLDFWSEKHGLHLHVSDNQVCGRRDCRFVVLAGELPFLLILA